MSKEYNARRREVYAWEAASSQAVSLVQVPELLAPGASGAPVRSITEQLLLQAAHCQLMGVLSSGLGNHQLPMILLQQQQSQLQQLQHNNAHQPSQTDPTLDAVKDREARVADREARVAAREETLLAQESALEWRQQSLAAREAAVAAHERLAESDAQEQDREVTTEEEEGNHEEEVAAEQEAPSQSISDDLALAQSIWRQQQQEEEEVAARRTKAAGAASRTSRPRKTKRPRTADDCPICLEVVHAADRGTTRCGHTFHHACLTSWLEMGATR